MPTPAALRPPATSLCLPPHPDWMSTSLDLSALSGCLSMHTSPSQTPPPTSPYTAAIELLHRAFALPNLHAWIADFIFAPEHLVVAELVSGVQNASAALVDLVFLPDCQFQADSIVSGHTSPPQQIPRVPTERFAAIPVFSKDGVTIGVQVRLRSTHGKPVLSNARFAFDNRTCTFLAVESPGEDRVAVTFMTTGAVQGRQVAFMELHAQSFRDLTARRKISAPLLLNALMSCEVYAELRTSCGVCGQSGGCRCVLRTGVPGHPMDFGSFAPNVVLFGGEWGGFRRAWRRSRDGVLVREPEGRVRCRIGVGVDEKGVTEMCEWGVSGLRGGEDYAQGVLRGVRAGERVYEANSVSSSLGGKRSSARSYNN